MARVTLKSQAIIIDQLTAQVAELTTQVGVLMNQLQAAQQDVPHHLQERIATLVDERNALIAENQRLVESCVAAHERCDALEAIVAKSATQPQRQVTAPKPLPSPAVVDAAPTIEITDLDRAMWRKFQALPREQRLAIIEFARPIVGHVGIHNIVTVRAAWHESQSQSVA